MNKKTAILLSLIILLAGGNLFLGFKYFQTWQELQHTNKLLETARMNDRVLDFTKLFISGVLQANQEVDFETRLQLENLVRSIGDQEILNQWNIFINSQSEAEAQESVKTLLSLLLSKVGE